MKTYLIDDDNLSTYLTEHLLRVEGFSNSVCTFHSAREALERLLVQAKEKLVPDIVFWT